MGRKLSSYERSVRWERRKYIALIACIIVGLLVFVLYVGGLVAMGDGPYQGD